MTFPRQTLGLLCSLCFFLSPALAHRRSHEYNTISFFPVLFFLFSLPPLSLVPHIPLQTLWMCVLLRSVCLEAKKEQSLTHTHTHHVLAVWGEGGCKWRRVRGKRREREGKKKKKKEVKGSIS